MLAVAKRGERMPEAPLGRTGRYRVDVFFCGLAGRHVLPRLQGIVAAGQHFGGKVPHDRLCLDVEVTQHDIRVPPSKESDDIGVNIGTEQGHGTAGTEGAGRDVLGEEAQGGAKSSNGCAEEVRDVGGGDGVSKGMVVQGEEVGGQGRVTWCLVSPEMDDSPGNGPRGAAHGGAAAAMVDNLTADTTLLGCECE